MTATSLEMRSDKFKSVKAAAPSPGFVAGVLTVLDSGLVGVPAETKDTGEETGFIYQCDKIVVDKLTGGGTSISQGAKVYYASNKVHGASATGRRFCGIALEAAGTSDATVLIELDGTKGIDAQDA